MDWPGPCPKGQPLLVYSPLCIYIDSVYLHFVRTISVKQTGSCRLNTISETESMRLITNCYVSFEDPPSRVLWNLALMQLFLNDY